MAKAIKDPWKYRLKLNNFKTWIILFGLGAILNIPLGLGGLFAPFLKTSGFPLALILAYFLLIVRNRWLYKYFPDIFERIKK